MNEMERISVDRLFETTDLYLAAYLLTRGLELWATDSHDPARVVFVLTPRPKPADLEAYLEGKADVNAIAFRRALRALKRVVWQIKDGRR